MEKFKFDKQTNRLFRAILSLRSIKEAELFFRDLCTIDEIRSMTERWEIVALLNKNMPYREIATKLNTSTTTVSRVAQWFSNGTGGYRLIKDRIDNKNHHNHSHL